MKAESRTPSAVLLRNATPPVFHRRHIGRVLRSSCHSTGRRLASKRHREPQLKLSLQPDVESEHRYFLGDTRAKNIFINRLKTIASKLRHRRTATLETQGA